VRRLARALDRRTPGHRRAASASRECGRRSSASIANSSRAPRLDGGVTVTPLISSASTPSNRTRNIAQQA
jgi:hypothetical protein